MNTRHPAEPEPGRAANTRPIAAVVVPVLTALLAIVTVLHTALLSFFLSQPDICFWIISQAPRSHHQDCVDARATHDMTGTYVTAGLAALQVAVVVGTWVLRRKAWAQWAAIPALLLLAAGAHLVPAPA